MQRNSNNPELTAREIQFLNLLCDDKDTKEIAAIVQLSTRTIEYHRIILKEKFDCKTIGGLVYKACKYGFISTEPQTT